MRHRSVVASLVLVALTALPVPASAGGDTTPPVLHSLAVSPGTVDVSAGDQLVDVTATVTDDLSGVAQAAFYLQSPSGEQTAGTYVLDQGGGVFTGQITFAQFAENGVWTFDIAGLIDNVGNQATLGLPALIALGINVAVGVGDFAASSQRRVTVQPRFFFRGQVRLISGEAACTRYVPVVLERKARTGWREVAGDLANRGGTYRIRVDGARSGKYRVVAVAAELGTPAVATCERAVSPIVQLD